MKKKFYVTTPIYYPNDIPHVGHAYTTIVADVLARWNRLKGNDVFFLTGTDDHGKKIAETAKDKGKKPKEFVDGLIPVFKENWKSLNIDYDKFIRTTDKDHEKVVQEMLQKSFDNGDIYKGNYEGLYCVGCEAYYTEKDLEDGRCPIHKKPVELIKEESYFFKLSKYQDKLLKLYGKNPNFILPKSKKNEIVNRVKEGLRDLSISRTSFDWGVPLPFDKKHVCYVWFDALFNYYSGGKKYWPANVHLIGKDILWFHSVYWPAFLMSVGLDLPKTVFAHGWWTFDKEKISKSRGKVLSVKELISIAGVDSARYFLCRATPFGDDGDFSEKALIERHNNELANKLGNLVSRVSGLIEKFGIEKTPNKFIKKLNEKKIEKLFENYEFDKVLNEIFAFIDDCNEYVQSKKIWETKDKKALYELKESILKIAELLQAFIPESAEKITKQFSAKNIKKGEILFKKIEIDEKINKNEKPEGIMTMSEVTFGDWEKLDLRVAQIKKVEDIEGADKLYKVELDVGKEIGKRIICAGLKEYYSKEDLKGKKIIYFSNLAPRKMRGIESQGMLLAASTEGHKKVVLIAPEKDIELGSRVG
ncbi:MAG: methionine--tRNA ligase [Nanoarchaeota archaeon]|nr:methionine--tRNA ligase [Nanoarchaeota archaeon]